MLPYLNFDQLVELVIRKMIVRGCPYNHLDKKKYFVLMLYFPVMRGPRNFRQGGGPGQSDKKSSDVLSF